MGKRAPRLRGSLFWESASVCSFLEACRYSDLLHGTPIHPPRASRMSRHHAKLDARRWATVRRAVFDRDGWRCVCCGRAGRLAAHHVQALDRGGAPYEPDNIETLCRACHIERHADDTPGRAAWRAWSRTLSA